MTAEMPQREALADNGIEEALRLARARAGGDQRGAPGVNGADRVVLMAVDMRDVGRDALAHVRMEHPLGNERIHRRAAPERARYAHEGALE